MATVNPAHHLVDLPAHRIVGDDALARGHGELDEADPAVLGRVVEEPLDRREAQADALRVVEPVDAEHHAPAGRLLPDSARLLLDRGARGELGEGGGIDADRIDAEAHAPAVVRERRRRRDRPRRRAGA